MLGYGTEEDNSQCKNSAKYSRLEDPQSPVCAKAMENQGLIFPPRDGESLVRSKRDISPSRRLTP
jgi:hypothetical protein